VSERIYAGPRRDSGEGRRGWVWTLPFIFAGLTVLGQILWVLAGPADRLILTIATVITFFLSTVSHALIHRGAGWTGVYLIITLGFGWGIEFLGTRTQFPFGDYIYASLLGPQLLGVPLVIPLAWSMMAYPCLLAVQRLVRTELAVALVGGFLLASWDLFLDPQMVGESYWTWRLVTYTLPGIPDIPLQNFLGWFLASFVLMLLLSFLPQTVARDGAPRFMLSWIFASNVFANLVFFDRPGVALWGGACMGAVMIPFWYRIWSQPQW